MVRVTMPLASACLLSMASSEHFASEHTGLLQQKNRGQVSIQAHQVDAPVVAYGECSFGGHACPLHVVAEMNNTVQGWKDVFRAKIDEAKLELTKFESLVEQTIASTAETVANTAATDAATAATEEATAATEEATATNNEETAATNEETAATKEETAETVKKTTALHDNIEKLEQCTDTVEADIVSLRKTMKDAAAAFAASSTLLETEVQGLKDRLIDTQTKALQVFTEFVKGTEEDSDPTLLQTQRALGWVEDRIREAKENIRRAREALERQVAELKERTIKLACDLGEEVFDHQCRSRVDAIRDGHQSALDKLNKFLDDAEASLQAEKDALTAANSASDEAAAASDEAAAASTQAAADSVEANAASDEAATASADAATASAEATAASDKAKRDFESATTKLQEAKADNGATLALLKDVEQEYVAMQVDHDQAIEALEGKVKHLERVSEKFKEKLLAVIDFDMEGEFSGVWQNSKCVWNSKYKERLFREPAQGSSSTLTSEQCKDQCANTVGCEFYSFGEWDGGVVCMGCNSMEHKDHAAGFTLHSLHNAN